MADRRHVRYYRTWQQAKIRSRVVLYPFSFREIKLLRLTSRRRFFPRQRNTNSFALSSTNDRLSRRRRVDGADFKRQ